MCGVLFCLLFLFLVSDRCYLDVAIYDNLQDLKEDLE
jgi:hypothetical protein